MANEITPDAKAQLDAYIDSQRKDASDDMVTDEDNGMVESLGQDLTEAVGQALMEAASRGMVLPLYIVAVAANGAMLYHKLTRPEGSPEAKVALLAEYCPTGAQLPVTVVIVDSEGASLRGVLEASGDPFYSFPDSLPDDSGH
jgi:hypothetical protein